MRPTVSAGLILVLAVGSAVAQNVISAHSGLVHYTEGKVLLAGKTVETNGVNFPQLKQAQELRTEQGRAEVLLTPGVFLRMAENSAIRMVSNSLTDSRLEFLAGSAVIESTDLPKDNAVTVMYKDSAVHLEKRGIYRFDSDPARVRVFEGEAKVEGGGQTLTVKNGRMLDFDGMAMQKFDAEVGDTLTRWSRRRAEYIAMANVSAAKSLLDSGYGWSSGGWIWNSYFGMFTFLPYRGSYWSPYGYRFWSPATVYMVYAPRPMMQTNNYGGGGSGRYNANLGYVGMSQTSSGHSGTIAASSASHGTAASAPAAGASSSGGGISRGGGQSGGGRR
ncbi:MAG: FecR domain-containing protein [Acidobacteria bacterium]|nr:FecR domain-containing protein [Acidobacteriota bacterium]